MEVVDIASVKLNPALKIKLNGIDVTNEWE